MNDQNPPVDQPATETAAASPSPPAVPAIPVTGAERIEYLDVLRGFAVLGILVMNIVAYADIHAAYSNHLARGAASASDWVVWTTNHLLADGKFMTIFSLLFGAGVALFADRLEARGRKPAGLHYRRMWWLWLIGMVHAYVLWWGDILVAYASCGAIVYLLRKLRPRVLIIIGVVLLLLPTLGGLGLAGLMDVMPPDAQEQMREGMLEMWAPDAETIQAEVDAYRGGWLDQMSQRAAGSAMMQFLGFWFGVSQRVGGLMLIGVALFRLGVLTGAAPRKVYGLFMGIGWGLGFLLIVAGLFYRRSIGDDPVQALFVGSQFNYWGSLGVAAGYIGMIALLVRGGALAWLRRALGAAGRMAFSNYLGQTIIFTTVFYGHGFGLFASVDRWQQALMVLATWVLQLAVSVWWLERFRFGPMEWVWRSLTYWQRQPMRRA